LISQPINRLGRPGTARFVVVLLLVWQGYGYAMVLFLAGLSTIPPELHEAAKMDGAGWFTSLVRITIPLLRPILVFVLLMSLIGGFRLFEEPVMLFPRGVGPLGGPERVALTPVLKLYDEGFQRFNLGYASAVSYGLFIVTSIASIALYRFLAGGGKSK